ncbi:TetR/AcrR family transcriptional regulator [Cellulomonas xylanilytica]|uniref:TetR family transcriptional regulator n=1 Tax=Cellulomonas xylanilytica TaxID=233583 RepID=A0A510V9G4_9CELL|nr:helix-turn-helix domain-containing protein [Cellulomonas xylanilytica]GEK21815.1 TetR family transcriptional regulator [Cellulomonas xylanilytica]
MTTDIATGARGRTRKAILDAAVRALAQDPAASLGQIADAADVGRTTLHRYFPDRAELLAAVAQEAGQQLSDAAGRARLDDGPGLDALLRSCQTLLQLGDLLTLMFSEVVSIEACGSELGFTQALDDACARGLADGTLDTRLTAGWVQGVLWSSLYLGWSELREGTTPSHDVVSQLLLTVRKALAAPAD